jgi:hypothetical protein
MLRDFPATVHVSVFVPGVRSPVPGGGGVVPLDPPLLDPPLLDPPLLDPPLLDPPLLDPPLLDPPLLVP